MNVAHAHEEVDTQGGQLALVYPCRYKTGMATTRGPSPVGSRRTKIEVADGKRRPATRIEKLESAVAELKKAIGRCGAITVPVTSLAPEPFELLKTIPVVVQPSDQEFIASFFDANINASGETETDAVANLKNVMLSVFQLLLDQPESKLGPGPRRQLAVLREFIVPKR